MGGCRKYPDNTTLRGGTCQAAPWWGPRPAWAAPAPRAPPRSARPTTATRPLAAASTSATTTASVTDASARIAPAARSRWGGLHHEYGM
jgi:hypothetical protein